MASPSAIKEEIFAHMAEVRAERKRATKMAQDCASKSGWAFQYDDKCGSQYLHLPVQVRETAATQGRYHYRFGLQGNLIPGTLLQYSLVPPCLKTGENLLCTRLTTPRTRTSNKGMLRRAFVAACVHTQVTCFCFDMAGVNFGCSALFGYWHRLAQLGKLPNTFVRMSDGGPDNSAATTHAFHWLAVHLGVFQRLEWLRLPSKHSHNYCDRTFSMVKEVILPKRGAGGGCNAPWDMNEVLTAALKSQRGPVELVWQWRNFNWSAWFKQMKAITKEFGSYCEYRHWVYEVSCAAQESALSASGDAWGRHD